MTGTAGTIALRRATAEDYPFLVSLYGQGRAAEMADWGWTEPQREEFIAMQYRHRRRYYDAVHPEREESIILLGEQEAGTLSLARGETGLTIVNIALLAELQGQGVGSALVRLLQREAASLRKPIRLHLLTANQRAERLYASLGFTAIGDDGVYRQLEWQPYQNQIASDRRDNA